MEFLKNNLLKFRYFSLRKFFSMLLQTFGVLWLLLEIISFFSSQASEQIKPYWWLFLLIGVVIGSYRGWPVLKVEARIHGTDSSIELLVTDMFSVPAAYVIGCNRTFDTSINDGIISTNSTQGQFMTRFCPSQRDLDAQIEANLDLDSATTLTRQKKPFGKLREFPIGTVASVSFNGKLAYLVAISSLNEHKVCFSSTADILDALPMAWEFIRTKGTLGPLCCPILGSAFSRVRATREELIREIIKSYVAASRAGRFCEKLTIAISPLDFWSGKVNLDTLRRFVEYECFYPTSLSSNSHQNPVGTAA